jgi:hypothetical protein
MPREPVIFSGLAEIDAWPARRWTPSSFAANVDTLPLVYTKTASTNGIFGPIWIPDKPMLTELQLQWPYQHALLNESSQSFFTNIASPPKVHHDPLMSLTIDHYMHYRANIDISWQRSRILMIN